MDYQVFDGGEGVSVSIARFLGAGGAIEIHLMLSGGAAGGIDAQLANLGRAYERALASLGTDLGSAVLRRFFCSDLLNQEESLRRCPLSNPAGPGSPCAVSWVGQPPAPPARVALWAYHLIEPDDTLRKSREGDHLVVRRGGLSHHWSTGLRAPGAEDASAQTRGIFEAYDARLRAHGMTLRDHAIRTWLFVRDIDLHYGGMVSARRELFTARGLTPQTHFIASSGIEGQHASPQTSVTMDAYAIAGLQPGQIRFLSAPGHLSPTHVYGVTFERGTCVAWADRTHVILSGTASIDRDGKIVHPGDMPRQLDRTLENVSALLSDAGATLADLAHLIVYVRDPADAEDARLCVRACCPGVPTVVVRAAVCRPGWLVELEGMAIVPARAPSLPPF